MPRTDWLRQHDQAAFPDLLWSRPENRALAGKLAIIGGNSYGFAAVAEAYTATFAAGIGEVRVLLPDTLRTVVGKAFDSVTFAANTPSGSLSQRALDEVLIDSSWADGVYAVGDMGRNSETAILIEKFIQKYSGQFTITRDAADYFLRSPQALLSRPHTTLVLSFAQLQKLASHAGFNQPFTFDMDVIRLVDSLREFSLRFPIAIITKHLSNVHVAFDGHVSSTAVRSDPASWRAATGSYASVWLLQNPTVPFQALTTAVFEWAQSVTQ